MGQIPHRFIHRPSVELGVNDSEYASSIATRQVSRAYNYDMAIDGRFESRGGSMRTSTSASAANEKVWLKFEYRKKTAGVVTSYFMVFAGTRLLLHDPDGDTFTEIDTGLAGVIPGVAVFRNSSGVDVMYYCDGTVFKYYNGGVGVTSIAANFQAGVAGATYPRFLLSKHERLWATGGTMESGLVAYSPIGHAQQDWASTGWVRVARGSENITGLKEVSDFPLITSEDSIFIVTGKAGSTDDPFKVVKVNGNYGCQSHSSIVVEGSRAYWYGNKLFYVGKLRAAIENGLDVEVISSNLQRTINTIDPDFASNIQGAYLGGDKQQIYWTAQTDGSNAPDMLLVYSVGRSNPDAPVDKEFGAERRFVWAGKWTGLTFRSVSVIRNSSDVHVLYVGGDDGFIRQMYTGFLDDVLLDESGGSGIDYQIHPREESFGGPANAVRVYAIYPHMHMRINGTAQFEYIRNQSIRSPSSPRVFYLTGNVPFLHETDVHVSSEIGSTIFKEKPVSTAKLRVGKKCRSFQAIITNVLSDTQSQAFSFSGYSIEIQNTKKTPVRDQ